MKKKNVFSITIKKILLQVKQFSKTKWTIKYEIHFHQRRLKIYTKVKTSFRNKRLYFFWPRLRAISANSFIFASSSRDQLLTVKRDIFKCTSIDKHAEYLLKWNREFHAMKSKHVIRTPSVLPRIVETSMKSHALINEITIT